MRCVRLLSFSYGVLRSHAISFFFFFNDTATTEIYTLSLHDALPICGKPSGRRPIEDAGPVPDVECGEVARTLDRSGLRLPLPAVASRMRADRRVGHDPLGGMGTRLGTELRRIEMNQQDLVQTRLVSNHPRRRIHRVSRHRRISERDVRHADGPAAAASARPHQAAVCPWPGR